jgi:uracil phosphoribosyltransferase
MASQLRVFVPPHPLIQHWLGIARDRQTPPKFFRQSMVELGRWLTYEAIRDWLPTQSIEIETPVASATATFIDPQTPLAIVPILRAGMGLLEGIQSVVPIESSVFHLGLARNETTLQPSWYLNKLPATLPPTARILVAEPMLATGGTIMAAMAELVSRGANPEYIRIISAVVAPPALQQLAATYPTLQIYAAIIDEELTDRGFISPGLGDAGDRFYGT